MEHPNSHQDLDTLSWVFSSHPPSCCVLGELLPQNIPTRIVPISLSSSSRTTAHGKSLTNRTTVPGSWLSDQKTNRLNNPKAKPLTQRLETLPHLQE